MPTPFRYDPAHTALVVVDVQNDFCSQDGALGRLGEDTSAVREMVPRLERLVESAHAAEVPVVLVRTLHDEASDTPQWLGRVGSGPGTGRTGLTCRPRTWGAEFYRIRPDARDHVITKHRFSAFVGTELHQLLQSLGVRSLMFTGATTEVCVESSLRDALFHEYYVSLVEDCCGSYEPGAHLASVRVVGRNFGTVVRAEELRRAWGETG